MYLASCLCQTVKFRLLDEMTDARYCHCALCRKFAGTCPASWAVAKWQALVIESGASKVKEFNSGGGLRCFCGRCGSPLWFKSLAHPELVAIPLGVFDSGPVPEPNSHIWTSSSPEWSSIHDGLTQFAKNPK